MRLDPVSYPIIDYEDGQSMIGIGCPFHTANRCYPIIVAPLTVLKGPVKQHLCWSCKTVVVQSLIKPLFTLKSFWQAMFRIGPFVYQIRNFSVFAHLDGGFLDIFFFIIASVV